MTDSGPNRSPAAPRRVLTLLDSTSIIVGIIIGAGIYESSPGVARNVPDVAWLLGVWLAGGLLSVVGALCYAELATAYPFQGGDYVYLTRALDRAAGFLFAWAQLWVVRPGSIGAMAYVFARYANQLWPIGEGSRALVIYASSSVLILTAINVAGVREGKWTQNLLTAIKILGLAAVVAIGLLVAAPQQPAAPPPVAKPDFRLAMILVLFTYGGWNEMAYVGAEVRDPRRNILRALLLGTVAVAMIYLLVNVAFVHALGFEGFRNAEAVAADMVTLHLGGRGGRAISLLICISALGAVNGQIFTGARIYYALGADHRLFSLLGRWSRRLGTPAWSLVVQAGITLALVLVFGLSKNGFESMVKYTTPIFWMFFLLVGLSLFVLRYREPDTHRPFRVPGYPLVPMVFCLSSLFVLYASLSYAIQQVSYEPLLAVVLMLVGVVLCFFGPKSA